MDTLKVGMKDTLEWEVTERLTTTRGEFKVFSTPSMCRSPKWRPTSSSRRTSNRARDRSV